ncbi:MAG: CPBP family intramembrane glutamic endopeptidase [Bacteroidales bacterium]|jgi:membrane protease YdiL (CAAX protease family)|nr:CPBP family intramembrane metalloprotease [Bacteroidales bacterium]MDD4044856.1 CPBP family intramembrane metalloprotease [Bacteroidales bacterium]MDX9889799.1 CPBP family intramembrane glutamic endopeptidase [Bacteroidales bacterium]NLO43076.1 CPBP family intramembrane metalloprotease [Bacteroidales bacterium]
MKHLERSLDQQNQWWKYVVILITGFLAANFVGAIPLAILIVLRSMQGYTPNPENPMDLSAYDIDLNTGLILLLIPFIISLLVIIPLIKNLHKRTWTEVINGSQKIRWNRFFFSFGIWMLLSAGWLGIELAMHPQDFVLQFQPLRFVFLIFIALFMIPFQTFYEEFMFRGYLTQGIAGWTKNRWTAIIIPALLFGLMHILNPEIKEYGFWLTMPQYVLFGLLFGLMVVVDDGIETAVGAHTANNIFLCVFITSKSSALQTYALYKEINIIPSIMDTVELLIMGSILIIILAIKYKWKFSVLNKKIEIETFK